MKYLPLTLIILLLISTRLLSQRPLLGCSLGDKFLKSDEMTLLAFRPIQENLIITEDRKETISLIVKEGTNIDKIVVNARYGYGLMEEKVSSQELTFLDNGTNGDDKADDLTFRSDDFLLFYEEWLSTYLQRTVSLDINFYDQGCQHIAQEHFFINYMVINPDYLDELEEVEPHYLTADSSVVHLGNSVYTEFEKNMNKYDEEGWQIREVGYDDAYNLRILYDSIWDQNVSAVIGSRDFGLDQLNSSTYCFTLSDGSGNYYKVGTKSGVQGLQTMFNGGTFVHELYHMYLPHFFDYFVEEVDESVFHQIGEFGTHNPVNFFGQTQFGSHFPLPIARADLCPDSFDELEYVEDGIEITLNKPCDTEGLNLVDGISENVANNFELFIMGLVDEDVLPDSVSFGFNPLRLEGGRGFDFVKWRFDNLITVPKELLVLMRNQWYNRDVSIFRDYYDARSKNLLIFFHGYGKRSLDELKTLHMLSDELVQDEINMDIPEWQVWGYQNDVYDRYISYEQATLGLGELRNEFPLPKGYVTTSIIRPSILNDEIQIYPNPTNDKIKLRGFEHEEVEIFNLQGERISQSLSQDVDLTSFTNALYILKTSKGNIIKLIKI